MTTWRGDSRVPGRFRTDRMTWARTDEFFGSDAVLPFALDTEAVDCQDGNGQAAAWIGDGVVIFVSTPPFPALGGLVFALAPVLVGQVTALDLVLVTAAGSSGAAGTLNVSYVPEINPLDYSAARLPGARAEVLVGSAAYVPGAGSETRITLSVATMAAILSNPSWGGRLALTLETPDNADLRFEAAEGIGVAPRVEVTQVGASSVDGAALRTDQMVDDRTVWAEAA